MKVAVTGATGFIGRHLVRALLARGCDVVGVVRDPERVPSLRRAGVELRRADLADPTALARAFAGADAVMANAGVVSIGAQSRALLMRANADGTRHVLEAMRAAGVPRVVLTSSASVYRRKRGVYREDDPLLEQDDFATPFGWYAISKAVAEHTAWRMAREHELELSVARPGGVYGAWDRTGFTSWLTRFMRPRLVSAFPTHLYVPNVYAGDLAEAMVSMLERPASVGRAYNLTGDPRVSFWDMLRGYRAAGGPTPALIVPIPIPLRFTYDLARAERELGFVNRAPLEAFTETLALEREG